MIQIQFIPHDGQAVTLEGEAGTSVMQLAVGAGLQGIVGECGGSAMCATCHLYVVEPWAGRLPPPSQPELEMLECTAAERRDNSRLGCQIKLAPELQGLTVRLPERQQ